MASSLFLYGFVLDDIFIDLLEAETTDIRNRLADCHALLDGIYRKGEQLLRELERTESGAQLEQMRRAVSAGRAELRLIKFETGHNVVPDLRALNTRLRKATQHLLPPGKIILSPRAKSLLSELLTMTEDAHRALVAQEQDKDNKKYEAKSQRIAEGIGQVRAKLLESASELTEESTAENANSRNVHRSAAVRALRAAIVKLNGLAQNYKIERIKQFVSMLQIVEDNTTRRPLDAQITIDSPDGFELVSYHPRPPLSLSLPSAAGPSNSHSFWDAIGQVLIKHGFLPKPPCRIQIGYCYYLCLVAWSSGRSPNEQAGIIAISLQCESLLRPLGVHIGGLDKQALLVLATDLANLCPPWKASCKKKRKKG